MTQPSCLSASNSFPVSLSPASIPEYKNTFSQPQSVLKNRYSFLQSTRKPKSRRVVVSVFCTSINAYLVFILFPVFILNGYDPSQTYPTLFINHGNNPASIVYFAMSDNLQMILASSSFP